MRRLFSIRPVNFESATGPDVAKRLITFMKRIGRKDYGTAVCIFVVLKVKTKKKMEREREFISKNLSNRNMAGTPASSQCKQQPNQLSHSLVLK